MKLSFILVSFFVAFTFLNQSFAEVYTTGSAADNNGNIIVIGYCLGNVAIGGEQFNITTPSAFILKLNSDGEKIWVKFINSTQSIKANAVAVDSSGNIYLTGEFSGTASFGSNILLAQNTDAFIVKLNVDGEFEWVKQGTSPNDSRGNDIYVSAELVYVCGYGNPITFDSLSASSGGFTIKLTSNGTLLGLYNTLHNSYSITIDAEENIIICGGDWSYVNHYYIPQLGKFTNQGNLIWKYHGVAPSNISTKFFTATDSCLNIYTALVHNYTTSTTFFSKSDSNGNTISPLLGYSKFGVNYFKFNDENYFFIAGYFFTNAQFGDSILYSNGGEDAYIAKIDTGFNPVWLKHSGGSYDDELNSILQLNDGNIVCSGNFKGTVSIDTIHITGGISINDTWVGIVKYDSIGNTVLARKIAEHFSPPDTTNWFPLEIGNMYQYFKKYSSYWSSEYGDYSIKSFQVTDSVRINNIKYYSVDGFYLFNSGTKIRYDKESQQILALYNNQEYLFMDFSKVSGEIFQQIQYNGSFRSTTISTKNLYILDDSVTAKGFYNIVRIGGGGGFPYGDLATWVYFAPEIGWVFQDEENYITALPKTDLFLIEQLIFNEGQSTHKKHTETATLIFQPVTFIAEGNSLIQNFIVYHPFSKQNVPASNGYFSYINTYLQSFYYNGADTIWNNNFNIPQTTEIDFSLDYQFDTTKYNQGYQLYYRIAAVDKGIIADTFYSPQTGYYKLFWKDSTTSVTQTEFEALTYSLSQNYPNPFNPVSKIVFTIPKRKNVSLKIYDILGSEITTLVNKELDAGKYEVDFSGKDLSSGIYIYQIKAGAFRETKKMILMR